MNKVKCTYFLILIMLTSCQAFKHTPKPSNNEEWPRIISMGAEFEEFIKLSRGLEPESKVRLFRSMFTDKYPDVYDSLVFERYLVKDYAKEKQERLDRYVPRLDRISTRMEPIFKELAVILPENMQEFKKLFPSADFRYYIYVMPSLKFNGKVGFLKDGSTVIAFGVDRLLSKADLNVLVSHELFHAFHIQNAQIMDEWIKGDFTYAHYMWLEGMAVYASGLLNPKKNDDVLLDSKELSLNCQKHAREYIIKFREVSAKSFSDPEYLDVFSMWFGGKETNSDMPARAAYCVGLNIVRDIAKEHDFNDMLKWKFDYVTGIVEKKMNEASQ
ncbi:MAG: DUF2268 domain-containing putative Zn-dependent protease [Pseudomonadota bacterium]